MRSNNHSFIIPLLSCFVGFITLSEAASAQSETFVTTAYLGAAGDPTNFKLPSFDSSLGTLESIDITLKLNLCPTISIYNSTSAGVKFTNAGISVPVSVDGPASLDFDTNLTATTTPNVTATAKPGTNTYYLARQSTFGSEQVDPTDFALWEDQSSKISLFVTPSSPTFSGTALGSGLVFGGASTEWGEISVVYNYFKTDAVPEPSSFYLSLIVGAGMALMVIGRRMKLRA